MSAWRDMASAPRDGTLVLLAYSTGDGPTDWSAATAKYAGVSWLDHYGNQIAFHPTHWMPLPEGPK